MKSIKIFLSIIVLLVIVLVFSLQAHAIPTIQLSDETITFDDDKNIYTTYKPIRKLKVDSQYKSTTIYTIQTGSFNSAADAQKHYDIIVQGLRKNELNFLRIEKIGNYHAVRLGKFLDYASADGFLQVLEPQLANTIILKANIKDERIIKIYEVGE